MLKVYTFCFMILYIIHYLQMLFCTVHYVFLYLCVVWEMFKMSGLITCNMGDIHDLIDFRWSSLGLHLSLGLIAVLCYWASLVRLPMHLFTYIVSNYSFFYYQSVSLWLKAIGQLGKILGVTIPFQDGWVCWGKKVWISSAQWYMYM